MTVTTLALIFWKLKIVEKCMEIGFKIVREAKGQRGG